MKTQSKLTLKFLEHSLRDLLQSTLQALEPMVRCRLETAGQKHLEAVDQQTSTASSLKIFIQHQQSKAENQQVNRILRQVIWLSYDLVRQSRDTGEELSAIQHIHVLLFFPGQKHPYAKRTVHLADAGFSLPKASLISTVLHPAEVEESSASALSGRPSESLQPVAAQAEESSDSDISKSNAPDSAVSDAALSDQATATEHPSAASESSEAPCFWNRWNIIKAIAAGVTLTLTGVSTYALTRPCVVGSCDVINTAQILNQESQHLLNTAAIPGEVITAEEVVTAYENLVEANYQLARIPFWSKYYDVAQELLGQYQEEADFVAQIVNAQRQAYEATLSAQEAPHPLPVWEDIRGQWQEAIAQLSTVPPDTGVTPLATTKLSEYQQYLSDIDQQIDQERAAQAKITEARQVAQIAEARESSASSAASWQLVFITWQVVINRLAEVPKETMAYAEAQQLNAIYSDRLATSQERHREEQRAQQAYSEATTLAEEALQHEQEGRLTQALVAWQNALTNVQQISEETSYYDQAQPLLSSYGEELARTEEALGTLARLETYRPLLNRACTASSPVCSYILEPEGIQIFMADAYAEGLSQFLSAGMTIEGEQANPSDGSPQLLKVTSLLQAISTIGDDSQIAIELYDSGNQLIATYEPSEGGYIQANAAPMDEIPQS